MTMPILAARNLRLSASVAGVHLGRTGLKATSVMLRRSPRVVRAQVKAPLARQVRPDLAALALAADGQGPAALTVLTEAIDALSEQEQESSDAGLSRAESRARRRLAQAAVVLHDLPLAERALGCFLSDVPADGERSAQRNDVAMQLTRALVAAEQGKLNIAIAHLEAVPQGAARRLRGRLIGEREVLCADLLSDSLTQAPTPRRRAPRGPVPSVLHAVSTSLPEQQTGYTVRTQGILAAQRAAGVDAQAVTRLGYPVDIGVFGAPTSVAHQHVPYHRLLPASGIPIPSAARQRVAMAELTRLVQRLRPEVLHAHSKHENGQIAVMVGRRLGVPVVYEARGFLEETWVTAGGDPGSDFYRWTRQAETRCMQHADRVVTLSSAMAHDIVGRGVDPRRVHVVPNAVASSFAQRSPGPSGGQRAQVRRRIRESLQIPMDASVFGTVSTLNDYEGLDTVIQAMAMSRASAHWLLIVGDGPARAALLAHAESAGVADRVIFVGRVRHHLVRDYLDAMDVFVVPRKQTSVTRLVPPLKPLEAMAVGLPVLASDLPPLAEIVRPGRYGYVVPPEEPAAWAERMGVLSGNPRHSEELGSRAAAFVAKHRTWTGAAEQYDDVYQMALCETLFLHPASA
ncbi:glycosyltransferase family 4 protein [soil metagenome]